MLLLTGAVSTPADRYFDTFMSCTEKLLANQVTTLPTLAGITLKLIHVH